MQTDRPREGASFGVVVAAGHQVRDARSPAQRRRALRPSLSGSGHEDVIRGRVAVVDVGGAKILTGVVPGVGKPIVHISASGTASFGSATVSLGVGPGGSLTTTVTKIVLP